MTANIYMFVAARKSALGYTTRAAYFADGRVLRKDKKDRAPTVDRAPVIYLRKAA